MLRRWQSLQLDSRYLFLECNAAHPKERGKEQKYTRCLYLVGGDLPLTVSLFHLSFLSPLYVSMADGSMLMLLYLFAVSRFPGKWEDRDKERTKDVAWEEEGNRE